MCDGLLVADNAMVRDDTLTSHHITFAYHDSVVHFTLKHLELIASIHIIVFSINKVCILGHLI